MSLKVGTKVTVVSCCEECSSHDSLRFSGIRAVITKVNHKFDQVEARIGSRVLELRTWEVETVESQKKSFIVKRNPSNKPETL